ncbi:hypothetical protein BC832DRAFT_559665 [Gaertneriomyces semiglobifer]|nr:hypothetical protein BC832DRAFT_559665 [Gaertneriomyces semiglobifer]
MSFPTPHTAWGRKMVPSTPPSASDSSLIIIPATPPPTTATTPESARDQAVHMLCAGKRFGVHRIYDDTPYRDRKRDRRGSGDDEEEVCVPSSPPYAGVWGCTGVSSPLGASEPWHDVGSVGDDGEESLEVVPSSVAEWASQDLFSKTGVGRSVGLEELLGEEWMSEGEMESVFGGRDDECVLEGEMCEYPSVELVESVYGKCEGRLEDESIDLGRPYYSHTRAHAFEYGEGQHDMSLSPSHPLSLSPISPIQPQKASLQELDMGGLNDKHNYRHIGLLQLSKSPINENSDINTTTSPHTHPSLTDDLLETDHFLGLSHVLSPYRPFTPSNHTPISPSQPLTERSTPRSAIASTQETIRISQTLTQETLILPASPRDETASGCAWGKCTCKRTPKLTSTRSSASRYLISDGRQRSGDTGQPFGRKIQTVIPARPEPSVRATPSLKPQVERSHVPLSQRPTFSPPKQTVTRTRRRPTSASTPQLVTDTIVTPSQLAYQQSTIQFPCRRQRLPRAAKAKTKPRIAKEEPVKLKRRRKRVRERTPVLNKEDTYKDEVSLTVRAPLL